MPDYLIPLCLVLAAFLLAPRRALSGTAAHPAAVLALIAAVTLISVRYLHWRITWTLDTSGSSAWETIFVWALFVIEMAAWFDTAVLFATLARRRNNSALADAGEARLRATPAGDLPTVDVFIATYNEDIDVLEKTIVGALALDWPRDRLRICVLDDGNRDWLRDYCARKGIDHLTRPDNSGAKAGNINAAIARTTGTYFMVLDADFVPQSNFLYRAIGLFEDPKVGIVQIPHNFYNADPLQANLRLRRAMPDDQHMFFGSIMAGRDGWNTAFCCGSNSITRRSAIEAVGGGLPTGSVTEDILLTMTMLRKGFVTRYLNERLAIGLAPESLSAMYVQRARWVRGAMQILFLRAGPFGPGLKLHQRILFLPFHWITQPLMVLTSLSVPAICLWTGWSPLPGTTPPAIIAFQLPALVATLGALRLLAPDGFLPLASMVHTALMAPRTLPTAIATLIRPTGHAFKVTPKGKAAAGDTMDKVMVFMPAVLIIATALGFLQNADFNSRVMTTFDQVPLLAVWAVLSMVVLSIMQAAAVASTGPNRDERFVLDLPCTISPRPNDSHAARVEWLSLSGAGLRVGDLDAFGHNVRWLRLDLPGFGPLSARVEKQEGDALRVQFAIRGEQDRDAMLRMLFTQGLDNSTHVEGSGASTLLMLERIFQPRRRHHSRHYRDPDETTPPQWLAELS
ncbi:glycosyltransferase [Pseudooceanicola sp. LIPI14-2-Ac024]|uniref:glycosyltransferase n=1 Tax=Pseudooceanicola sp. LIPI14-2-Ac024 TaxID=3344875 RepID=UPI0035D02CF9